MLKCTLLFARNIREILQTQQKKQEDKQENSKVQDIPLTARIIIDSTRLRTLFRSLKVLTVALEDAFRCLVVLFFVNMRFTIVCI